MLFWRRGEEGEEGQSLTKGRKIVEIAGEAEMGSEGKGEMVFKEGSKGEKALMGERWGGR